MLEMDLSLRNILNKIKIIEDNCVDLNSKFLEVGDAIDDLKESAEEVSYYLQERIKANKAPFMEEEIHKMYQILSSMIKKNNEKS